LPNDTSLASRSSPALSAMWDRKGDEVTEGITLWRTAQETMNTGKSGQEAETGGAEDRTLRFSRYLYENLLWNVEMHMSAS
jgi:hypothetical protein